MEERRTELVLHLELNSVERTGSVTIPTTRAKYVLANSQGLDLGVERDGVRRLVADSSPLVVLDRRHKVLLPSILGLDELLKVLALRKHSLEDVALLVRSFERLGSRGDGRGVASDAALVGIWEEAQKDARKDW